MRRFREGAPQRCARIGYTASSIIASMATMRTAAARAKNLLVLSMRVSPARHPINPGYAQVKHPGCHR